MATYYYITTNTTSQIPKKNLFLIVGSQKRFIILHATRNWHCNHTLLRSRFDPKGLKTTLSGFSFFLFNQKGFISPFL